MIRSSQTVSEDDEDGVPLPKPVRIDPRAQQRGLHQATNRFDMVRPGVSMILVAEGGTDHPGQIIVLIAASCDGQGEIDTVIAVPQSQNQAPWQWGTTSGQSIVQPNWVPVQDQVNRPG